MDDLDILTIVFILVFIGMIIYAVVVAHQPLVVKDVQISGAYLYIRSGDEVLYSNYNPNFTVNGYTGETFPVGVTLGSFPERIEVYNVTVGSPFSLVSVSPSLPVVIGPEQRVNITLQVRAPDWQSYNGPLSVTVYVRNTSATPTASAITETVTQSTTYATTGTKTVTLTSTTTMTATQITTVTETVTDYGPLGVPPYVLLVALIVAVIAVVIVLKR